MEFIDTRGIESKEYKEQQGEAPEGGSAVTEERQRDADNGQESEHHTNVDSKVNKEDAGNGIGIDLREGIALTFSKVDKADDKESVNGNDGESADKAPLLAYCAEDKVGILFGYETKFSLCTLEKTFTEEPP